MKVLIYTYPPHYAQAALCARSIRRTGATPVVAIDQSDPALFLEDAQVIRTDFERRGNLNGKAFLVGHLRLLQRIADCDEWVCKCDSDTMWLGVDWMRDRTETVVGLSTPGIHPLYGLTYAIRTSALSDLYDAAQSLQTDDRLPEDVTMAELATRVGTLHTWHHKAADSPLGAWDWETTESVESWKSRLQVICFQAGHGHRRREVLNAMQRFL